MYEKWKEQYEKTISKFPERKKVFKTTSGYVVKPFYLCGFPIVEIYRRA